MFRLSCAFMHILVFLEFPGAQGSNGRRHSRRLRGQQSDVPGRSEYYDPGHYAKKQEFQLVCRDELRSKAADGMLSQVEFAAFLFDFCSDDPQRGSACEEGLSFPSLAAEVQLNFVGGLCPSNAIQRLECLEFLNNQGLLFGYTEELEELCVSTSALLGSSGLLDFGGSTLITLPSVGSEPTDASTERNPDVETPIEPYATLKREKPRKEKKEHIGGTSMSKSGKKNRKDSFEGIAEEARVAEPSSMPSGDSLRSSSPPDSVDDSSTPRTALPLDSNSILPTTSATSPSGPFDVSDPNSISPTTSAASPSVDASAETISMTSRLGLSAAGFAVVILAVCSASKRRRTENGVMFKDSALDGGESIISVESGVVEFAVQNGATLNANARGKAGGGRKPSTIMDRFKYQSRQPSQARSFGAEMSEHERINILWGSTVSSRGFFRRQSARIRRHVFDNRSSDGDVTLEDDSTLEGKDHTEADNSAPRPGRKSESDQIAGGPMDTVGNEAEDFVGPVTRRAWRTKASRPFYTVFGVSNGEKCTEDSVDLDLDLDEEEDDEEVNFQEVESMSRSDWKRTLVESYDDETSLGSLAAVSAEVRKQFKDFDANLTKGFVDLDSQRAANAQDDDSVNSGQSLHLDILAKELTSCDVERIDRVRETEDSLEDAALTSPTEVSPQIKIDVTPSRQRRNHQANAVLLEDKPWRRETQGQRSTKISKTAKIAETFESSRPNPAPIDLASAKDPQGEEDGQQHVADKSPSVTVEFGHGEKKASTPLPSLPLKGNVNDQNSPQDDAMLADADASQISACNGQSDDDIVGVNALRNIFEGPSHSSSPAVLALLAARRQDH
jgi:hypothetical protein